MNAARTTARYGMLQRSAMIKAAAPMMGGMSCPFVLAATSTAAAFSAG